MTDDKQLIKKVTLAASSVIVLASFVMAALSIHADGTVQPASALAAIMGLLVANLVVNLGRLIQ